LCLLLERVQDVNSLADGSQIDDAIGARRLTYPDLANTGPIDVIGFQSDGSSPI
jgi:hypothetical protein